MTRPTERFAKVEAAGEVLEDRGAFWVRSPWTYPADRNLSAYEANQVHLNAGGFRLFNVTRICGAGDRGDGRGCLVADVDGDLAPDLIVRQAGGGAVKIFSNRFPDAGRLTVSLRGTKSNRLGIGARLTATMGERRLVRQLWTHNNFITQQAPRVRFGLGAAARVDRLEIRWPSGAVQVLTDVPAGRHIRVTEGEDGYAVAGSG